MGNKDTWRKGVQKGKCYNCGKFGHIAAACWQQKKLTNFDETKSTSGSEPEGEGLNTLWDASAWPQIYDPITREKQQPWVPVRSKRGWKQFAMSLEEQKGDVENTLMWTKSMGNAATKITFIADSGASETVIPKEALPDIPIHEGPKTGTRYCSTAGNAIINLGEKTIKCRAEGMNKCITAQVCDVKKPLFSIRQSVKAGHRVVFEEGPNKSYIENRKTGSKIYMRDNGGTYDLEVEVLKPCFRRQGTQ